MPFKKKIHTGFLAQEPFLSLVAQVSTPRTLLLPFLAGTGSHLTEDIPEALEAARFRGVLLPALGEADFIADLIAHSLNTAKLRKVNFDPLSQPVPAVPLAPSGPTQTADAACNEVRQADAEIAGTSSSPGARRSAASAVSKLVRRLRNRVLAWNGPSGKRHGTASSTKPVSPLDTNPTKSQAA